MSFEIKYDREGAPLRNQIPEEMVKAADEAPQVSIEAPEEAIEEITTTPESNVESVTIAPEPAPVAPKRASKEDNFEALRERAWQAERRARELEEELKTKKTEQAAVPEENLDLHIDEDSLVEGKHLSKVDKKIQRLESQLKQYQQQATLSTTEARLKQQYPDFDKVVSAENLANLNASFPEISQSINSNTDLYSKAVTAYTMIKRLGIEPQEDRFQEEKAQAQRNAAKPKSLASISPQQGDSPLSKANAFANGKLTDELKAQMWKEMNEYRK